tara:strand:+ start:202 stop:648 length:447 start_codon:yes stop_codon:yes gene_type:complete
MMNKKDFINGEVYRKGDYLIIKDTSVMCYLEENGIKEATLKLCKKIKPKKVLEIGFGLGFTATTFQDYGVKEHTIIEAHPLIYKKAKEWSKNYNGIKVINSFIQEFKYDEKDYDLVFDDRHELVYPLNGDITPRYKTKDMEEWQTDLM